MAGGMCGVVERSHAPKRRGQNHPRIGQAEQGNCAKAAGGNGPGHGRTDVLNGSGPEVAVAPEAGLGVIHFPSTTPENGGWTDYNAFHEAEPPGEGCVKYVCQQFIWSHPRLDWTRVLDEENWEPQTRISDDTI